MLSAGEISKDLWVLADGPVRPVTLLADEDEKAAAAVYRSVSVQYSMPGGRML
jgi:hypothetical protein